MPLSLDIEVFSFLFFSLFLFNECGSSFSLFPTHEYFYVCFDLLRLFSNVKFACVAVDATMC